MFQRLTILQTVSHPKTHLLIIYLSQSDYPMAQSYHIKQCTRIVLKFWLVFLYFRQPQCWDVWTNLQFLVLTQPSTRSIRSCSKTTNIADTKSKSPTMKRKRQNNLSKSFCSSHWKVKYYYFKEFVSPVLKIQMS